jgi:excisionase family DNA binding protein
VKSAAIAPRLLRTKPAANYLGIAPKKLRRLVQDGRLPVVEDGDGAPWRFDIRDLDAYVERSKKLFSA